MIGRIKSVATNVRIFFLRLPRSIANSWQGSYRLRFHWIGKVLIAALATRKLKFMHQNCNLIFICVNKFFW